jgi:class 3 adenylate cyclase
MFLDMATRVFNGVVSIVGTQIEVLTNILKALAALFRGDFSAMWGYLGEAALTMVKGIGKAFAAMFPEVVSWVKKTWEGVKLWLVDKFVSIVKAVQEKIAAVTGFFKAMWDAVVGHSYVPDMVDGIRDEFARLDEVMVRPALKATEKVDAAFKKLQQGMGVKIGSLQNGRGPNAPANDNGHGGGSPDIGIFGGKVMTTQRIEEMREQFVSFGRSFVDAVRAGKLDEFFAEIANRFVDKLIDQGLNLLFNAMGKGSSGGGALGSILSGVFGGQSVPGFATGGSFTVGGSGGTDSQLMRFRATPGEMVNITKGERGQRQGGTNVFDMRGAVVTQDLLNQMNQIAAEGDARVIGAVAKAQTTRDTMARRKIGRGG